MNWSLSPSLMSGQVDAVIGAFRNFELNQMEIEGVDGRCFYLEEEGLPSGTRQTDFGFAFPMAISSIVKRLTRPSARREPRAFSLSRSL